VLDLAKGASGLTSSERGWMGLGLVVSFVSAWAAVRWFLRYVSRHSLVVFAAYRAVLGLVVLLLLRDGPP
jgi:undecaprenyl-diphosphatase